jgi:hypothetical protein
MTTAPDGPVFTDDKAEPVSNKILFDTYHLRINFINPILGSQPGSGTPASNYLKDKIKKDNPDAPVEQDQETLPEMMTKGTTCFFRDKTMLHPVLKSYQVKGLLKECGEVLNGVAELKALRSKLDNVLFVSPSDLPIKKESGELFSVEELQICERPLRAITMQGPRTSLARSEMVPAETYIECDIKMLSVPRYKIKEEVLRILLDYGMLKGFGQWRNSGMYGQFTYHLEKTN